MSRRCFSERAVLWTAVLWTAVLWTAGFGVVFLLSGCGGPSAGDSTSRAAPSSPSSAPPPPPAPPAPDLVSPVTAASAPPTPSEADEPPPVAEPAAEPPSKPADIKVELDPPPAEEKRPPTVDEVQQAIEQAGGRVLKESGRLVRVFLNRSQATDETMQLLQYLPDLEVLNLTGAKVSDAGLAHLAGLSNLKRIYPAATQITDAALSQLQQSLPQLRVMK